MIIGVLGCGWLGLPLALELKNRGYEIKGTVSSEAKARSLQDQLNVVALKVNEDGVEGDSCFFQGLEVLVIAIPPQLRSNPKANFLKKMGHILAAAQKKGIKKVIYIGTIAVFPNENKTFDEDSIPVPFDDKSKQLIAAEELVWQYGDNSTIVRMGGLINQERHPVTMLAKRKSIPNPEASINLIHQKDAVGILCEVIEKEAWNQILHGVVLNNETKKEFYSKEAIKRGLELNFEQDQSSVGKKVFAQKTLQILGYSPKVYKEA